jgi:hypothetical protein
MGCTPFFFRKDSGTPLFEEPFLHLQAGSFDMTTQSTAIPPWTRPISSDMTTP